MLKDISSGCKFEINEEVKKYGEEESTVYEIALNRAQPTVISKNKDPPGYHHPVPVVKHFYPDVQTHSLPPESRNRNHNIFIHQVPHWLC